MAFDVASALTALFTIVLVLVILFYTTKSVSPVLPFLYANARLTARSRHLITDNQLSSLAEMKSMSSMISALRDTDYFEQVEKSNDLRSFQVAIERSMIDTLTELKKLSPDILNNVFDSYMMLWEGKVLKTVFRAKFSKIPVEQIHEGLVFSVGSINESLLKHLLDAETAADLGVVMSKTDYAPVFEERYDSIEHFEVALDTFILTGLIDSLKEKKMYDGPAVMDIIRMKYDIMNILVMIKAQIREVPIEERKKLLIDNGSRLSERFEQLSKAENIQQIVDATEKLPYHEALLEALSKYNKDGTLESFEKELSKLFKRVVIGNELNHPQGPYQIFSYLIKKENEQKNLFAISKGIDSGFKPEDIKEVLI